MAERRSRDGPRARVAVRAAADRRAPVNGGPHRRARLSRSAEFERVYRQGRSQANRHLVLYAFASEAAERPRLGLSVSRKVGGAVDRNRVKRLLREAFARMESELPPGHDLVLVARPEARRLAERDGLAGIETALGDLLERTGLRSAAATTGERQ